MKGWIRRLLPLLAALCLLLALSAAASAAGETLRFPGGIEVSADAESVDLSALTHRDVSETAALLGRMENLRHVDLGADRAVTRLERDGTPLPAPTQVGAAFGAIQELPAVETDEERLSWADIRLLVEAAPGAEVEYRFHIGNLRFSTLDKSLDVNHIRFDDEGALIRQILPCMQNLRTLDMDFCGVSNESMAAIRDAYPEVKVIWRVWFAGDCSVRTDVERLLLSNIALYDSNCADLRYCTSVRYLDVGHDGFLTDLSYVSEMRDLEVLIVSITSYSDLTPLTGLQKLEFFEGCTSATWATVDLTPLSTCPNLKHVNICQLRSVTGYESLAKLTKLERLWIGASTPVPAEAVEELRRALPDTEINTTEGTGCIGTWRYDELGRDVPRYARLCRQFDYANYDTVVAFFYNDPKYFSPNR